jgi:hypothetical protein
MNQKKTHYPTNKGQGVSQSLTERSGEDKILLNLPGIESQIGQTCSLVTTLTRPTCPAITSNIQHTNLYPLGVLNRWQFFNSSGTFQTE